MEAKQADNNDQQPSSNLPDISTLSKSDRKELLRQLLQYEQEEEKNIQQQEDDEAYPIVPDGDGHIIDINDGDNNLPTLSNLTPKYSSKSIAVWFFAACAVSALFSLEDILCLLFQDSNDFYCTDLLLDSGESVVYFCITCPCIIALIIITYYILLHKNKRNIDGIIANIPNNTENNNNANINTQQPFLVKNKDILNHINRLNKWYIWWMILTFCLSYITGPIITIAASIRGDEIFAQAAAQSAIYAVPFNWGAPILISVYWSLFLIFFTIFIHSQLCQIVTELALAEGIISHPAANNNEHQQLLPNQQDNQNYDALLLKFRDYMLCFRFYLIILAISSTICVSITIWNFLVIIGTMFATLNGGGEYAAVYLIWGLFATCAFVITALCRYRLSRTLASIQTIINKNINPLKLSLYIHQDPNAMMVRMSSANSQELNDGFMDRLKRFWRKYEKWIINGHSVVSLIAFTVFFNAMITDGLEEVASYMFVSFGIMLCSGYLVLQLFLVDRNNRAKIMYKSFLLLVTIFFIMRSNYFRHKADDGKKHHFVLFRVIFTILAIFGALFILVLTVKRELFSYILQIDEHRMKLLRALIPGKIGGNNNNSKYDKWWLLQVVFTISSLNTIVAVLWCIIYANNHDSEQLFYLYVLVWIVPVFYFHNEIVQYIRVYVDEYYLKEQEQETEGKDDNVHLVSFGLIQLWQPIVIIALCTSFGYLERYGRNELGDLPLVCCGIELFGVMIASIIALWQ